MRMLDPKVDRTHPEGVRRSREGVGWNPASNSEAGGRDLKGEGTGGYQGEGR